jgi:hypothetical protein
MNDIWIWLFVVMVAIFVVEIFMLFALRKLEILLLMLTAPPRNAAPAGTKENPIKVRS